MQHMYGLNMNPRREKALIILILSVFFLSGMLHSSEQIENFSSEHEGSPSSSSSSSSFSTVVESMYYSSSQVHLMDDISKQTEDMIIKSRQPIPKPYENNFVDVDIILEKISKNIHQMFLSSSSSSSSISSSSNLDEDDSTNPEDDTQKRSYKDKTILPFYWHIGRSGSGTISRILGQCLGLTIASSSSIYRSEQQGINYELYKNIFQDDADDEEVDALRIRWFEKSTFVNVDLETNHGIERASILKLLQNNITYQDEAHSVDVLISPLVYDISNVLFENAELINGTKTKASLFTMFREPMEREISYFYHMRRFSPIDIIHKFELSDWLHSEYYLDNRMVRTLINKMDQKKEITMDDLLSAKEVIRRKCIVGLLEQKAESWDRFQQSYREYWDMRSKRLREDSTRHCHSELLSYGWSNKNQYVYPQESRLERLHHEILQMLEDSNEFDLILYKYAKHLFNEQGKYFKINY